MDGILYSNTLDLFLLVLKVPIYCHIGRSFKYKYSLHSTDLTESAVEECLRALLVHIFEKYVFHCKN